MTAMKNAVAIMRANKNARPKERACAEQARRRSFLVVESLHHGENLPLTVDFCKRHVIRTSGSDEFGGCNVSRQIEHTNLFRALRLRQASAITAPCGLH